MGRSDSDSDDISSVTRKNNDGSLRRVEFDLGEMFCYSDYLKYVEA